MTIINMRLKLVMDNPPVTSINSELTEFPPPDDFPICIDEDGNVTARFCDESWPMTQWCGRVSTFNFGHVSTPKSAPWATAQDSFYFRCVMVFMMWCGPNSIKPSTLFTRYGVLRVIFKFCANAGVSVVELHKFPHLVDALVLACPKSLSHLVKVLREIYDNREFLGFMILNLEQISDLHVALSSHVSNQTPYIPTRISDLHLARSLELIEDFNAHSENFERLFDQAWEGYLTNNGDPCTWHEITTLSSPFTKRAAASKGCVYYGSFASAASLHGVEHVLSKWMCASGRAYDSLKLGALSRFFSTVALIGATCIASLSAMRKDEINHLRADCFTIKETDEGPAYFLQGATTKTIQDSDALWVTCVDTRKVVTAMTTVSKMRMKCVVARGVKHDVSELEQPFLILRAYEPWGGHYQESDGSSTNIRRGLSALTIDLQCPDFFPPGSTVITEKDFDEAVKVNPSLDIERFAVGKPWCFAFHQFRRTLMVNANESNLVSPQSQQYQLKHLYQSMTRYYGRNSSGLAVNKQTVEEFVGVFYESMARKAAALKSPDFVSLISPLHKERTVGFIEGKSFKELVGMAKKAKFSLKETIIGVCLNREPCEFGSADYVLACDKCVSGLASKKNLPMIQKTNNWIEEQLEDAVGDGPRRESLIAQHNFTQRLINVTLKD